MITRQRTSGAPRGPRQASRRLDNILDAATAILSCQGVQNLSVDGVAAKAMVAKGTVYHYFESRDCLLAAVVDRHASRLISDIENRISSLDWPLSQRLDIWVESVCSDYLNNISIYRSRPKMGWNEFPIVVSLSGLISASKDQEHSLVSDSIIDAVFLFNGLRGILDDSIASARDNTVATRCIVRNFHAVCVPLGRNEEAGKFWRAAIGKQRLKGK